MTFGGDTLPLKFKLTIDIHGSNVYGMDVKKTVNGVTTTIGNVQQSGFVSEGGGTYYVFLGEVEVEILKEEINGYIEIVMGGASAWTFSPVYSNVVKLQTLL